MLFRERVEERLFELAQPFTPPGSQPKAVVHQWVHAIHGGAMLFAEQRGVDRQAVLQQLVAADVMTPQHVFTDEALRAFRLRDAGAPSFRFIDLFAGIGGFRLGLGAAGGSCVFSSEFNKHAQATYEDNHGEFPFGDITQIAETDIPKHDVLAAGFPCQPFSHAGRKLGIDDTRGTLFHDIARILDAKRPKIALLENVKGLISHDKGHTLQVILQTLTQIGYKCIIDREIIENGSVAEIKKQAKPMVLKSREFGVPQNRQRIYIVLWREDMDIEFEYPTPPRTPTRVGDILEDDPLAKYTISDRLWEGHQRRKINNKKNGKGFGYGLVTPESEYTNTISARYYKDGSEILIAQDNQNPRKITPREAARIQGFPEWFEVSGSDVQAYKQFGNSVSVPVISALAEQIASLF